MEENDLKDIHQNVTKYVNKKVMTKGQHIFLNSLTVEHQLLICILNISQQRYHGYSGYRDIKKMMRKFPDYRCPAWAEGATKLIQYYGKIIRFFQNGSCG